MQFGPYEVLAELGQGSMGVVYRALDRRLHREVALKVLHGSPDADASTRFVTEARAIARLRHPNVVSLHDAGVWDGHRVLVLELVEGCLRDHLRRGVLAPRDAAALVRDLARGVHAAHQSGILHRDLKPANVLIDSDGRPRLTDFGLAIETRSLESSSAEAGWMTGTPAYMAPEQIAGAVETFGPWTDVWGLGCILQQCLTAKPPFGRGPLPQTLKRIQREAPVAIPECPDALLAIRDHALAKRPRNRFQSALELAEALDAFIRGEDAPLPAAPSTRDRLLLRVSATLTALSLAVLLFVVAARRPVAAHMPGNSTPGITNARR
ncbi:MAG: serine/threonine-protein kinase [Planctomycetota bacterium]